MVFNIPVKKYFYLIFMMICTHTASVHAFCVSQFPRDKNIGKDCLTGSHIIYAKQGDQNTLSFKLEAQQSKENFSMIIPVPEVLSIDQITIVDPEIFTLLDNYTAPIAVEVAEPSSCAINEPIPEGGYMNHYQYPYGNGAMMYDSSINSGDEKKTDLVYKTLLQLGQYPMEKDLGITVHAGYAIGPYEIKIISVNLDFPELFTYWLEQLEYHFPDTLMHEIAPYIKQDMKFLIAKTSSQNISDKAAQELPPLQIRFSSKDFVLPTKLSMIHMLQPSDVTLYIVTPSQKVEVDEHPNLPMPSGISVPALIYKNFEEFHQTVFLHQQKINRPDSIFTEHFSHIQYCPACSGKPLTKSQLEKIVPWTYSDKVDFLPEPSDSPKYRKLIAQYIRKQYDSPAVVTRMHFQYDVRNFPDDLHFSETKAFDPMHRLASTNYHIQFFPYAKAKVNPKTTSKKCVKWHIKHAKEEKQKANPDNH